MEERMALFLFIVPHKNILRTRLIFPMNLFTVMIKRG
ncbi:hypothetical protein SOVF_045820 [Spinacia oleracea]|nr:hypothetical protein SOVF_045820 [Spinacia oleracea]